VQRHAEAVQLLNNVEILHAVGNTEQIEKFVFEEKFVSGIKTLIIYYKSSYNPLKNFLRRMKAYKMGFSKLKKPDLVHANILQKSMLFAVYLKKKYKIPFVISEHWSGFLPETQSKISAGEKYIARLIANEASAVLPVSKRLRDNLRILNIGRNFEVVGNVIDTNLFHPETKKEQPFIFLHVSNLISLKNPDAIIQSALKLRKKYQDFELHIGGDGDYLRLSRMVEENKAGDFIKVFGEISHQEVVQKVRLSQCFVLFSDYESFSCVLLESLSAGVPVITTDVGIVSELDVNAGSIIRKSEEELYIAMEKMLLGNVKTDSPMQLHQYIAENYSAEKIAGFFNKIYQNIS